MKIVCLCENTPFEERFHAEHGLSLYIEANGLKILFDMGQSDVFLKNAELLGVDLSEVDVALLSHGHYDHGGGIEAFFKINKKAKLYLSEYAFGNYYNADEKYIGLDKALKGNERLVEVEDYYKIADGIELISCNDRPLAEGIDSAGLRVKSGEVFFPDLFLHEQYMKVRENGKIYLFSGCSHRGIINIAEWFSPDVLIGGFHFMKQDVPSPMLERASLVLSRKDITYYTCHCTGVEQYEYLKNIMKGKLNYLASGQILNI